LYLLVFLTILYLVFVGIGFAWNSANGNPGQWFSPFKFIAGATFPGRCTEFLAGMWLAQYLKNGATWLQKWKYKTAFGFAGILLTTYAIGLFEPDIFHHGSDHPIGFLIQNLVLPIFTVLTLAGLIFENNFVQRFFGNKWLVLLGNASFAFYLVHISYVNLKIKSWILLPDRNFVLLWLVSIAFYLLFEKPLYDWGRKKLKGIK
jgi:peptidoglycan/LPS O-acetylase OafA/YrhL